VALWTVIYKRHRVCQVPSSSSKTPFFLAPMFVHQSWKLSTSRRDDYAPNTGGMKQWEFDRKQWQADRLLEVVQVRWCKMVQGATENFMLCHGEGELFLGVVM